MFQISADEKGKQAESRRNIKHCEMWSIIINLNKSIIAPSCVCRADAVLLMFIYAKRNCDTTSNNSVRRTEKFGNAA